ncbi:MAG: histidine kinase [Bacteroidota bacterium]
MRALIGYILVGTISCTSGPVEERLNSPSSNVESLVLERFDSNQIVGMLDELMEVVMAPPADRLFSQWYHKSDDWVEVYGDRENLLLLYRLAYERNLSDGRLWEAAKIQGAIGEIYLLDGEYPNALKAQNLAFDHALQSGDSLLMAQALCGVGSALVFGNDTIRAEQYLNRSLEIAKSNGSLDIESMALYNLAAFFSDRFQVDTALLLAEAAYEAARRGGYEQLEIPPRLRMASYLTYNHRPYEAIGILNGLIDRVPAPRRLDLAYAHLLSYYAYSVAKDVEEADAALVTACEMMTDIKYGYGVQLCAIEQSKQAAARENFEEAYHRYLSYHELYTNQEGRDARREVQSLETELQLREKDIEIEQLNRAQMEKDEAYRRRITLTLLGLLILFILGLSAYLILRAKLKTQLAEERRNAAETKLQLLQSQMNPHFVFNAISGIQNAVLRAEKMEAFNYLSKFASLLRTSTGFSSNLHIEFSKEIEFIRNYLTLERMRVREAFDFRIDIQEDLQVCSQDIPAMIIQPVVENALVHGLAGIDKEGLLTIVFESTGPHGIRCTVTDNGRGRQAAESLDTSGKSSRHLSIATHNSEQRLAYLRELGNKYASIAIEDLYVHNKAAGTRVIIELPFLDGGALV